jgi:HEAT repeat protein
VFKPLAYNVEVDQVENQPASEKEWEEIFFTKKMESLPGLMNRELYLLTPEEVEKLREEVAGEIDPTFIFNVIDIFFEILAIEKEPEPYQDAATVLDKLLDAFLTLGEFQKAKELLSRLHFISQTHTLKDWQAEIIQQFILKAGEAKRIERIGNILEKEEKVRLEEVHDYLLLLKQNAIEPLVNVLGKLENLKTRKLLCDILCELGKNSVESFFPFVDDRRWFLVRNIIYILGRLGKEGAIPHIQKVFKREDVRVRKEAVQALGLIGGTKAGELLVNALADEDGRIRGMAALNLAKVMKHASLPHLLGIIQSKDFRKRDPSEIKAFFDAIGMVGSNEAIPVLQQLMGKKGWLGLGRIDEIYNGATHALVMIGTPEAKALLKSDKSL